MDEKAEDTRCPYSSGDKCKAKVDFETIKDSNCKNETKDDCCYTCKLNEQCESKCDYMDERKEDNVFPKSLKVAGLSKEERLKLGYDVLIRIYLLVGSLLVVVSLILVFTFTWIGYLQLTGFYWQLYANYGSGESLIHLVFVFSPLILVLIGVTLIYYGFIRMAKLKRSNSSEKQ